MRDKLLVVFCSLCSFAIAQPPQTDTIAKPLSDKEKKKRDQKLRRELVSPYRIWLNEDVAYIITGEERSAFRQLSTDDERQSFIEQFWLRRDPTPDTEENEFKEEHYRRIAYANEHFASGIPGWKTDRGRTYIVYGPPDEIESHPSGGSYQLPQDQGGGQSQAFPFETWRYRYIERIGANVVFEFVDPSMSGEYHITIDPTEKNAFAHTPLTPQPPTTGSSSMRDEFAPLEQLSNWGKPPAIKYTDLEAMVSTTVRYNTLPMSVRTDFIPVTPASIYANITLQFSASNPTINLYGRVTTMSRRVVKVFEDVVTVDSPSQLPAVYQKSIPLAPGRYRLNIAAKDVNGGNTATYEAALDVPQFEEDKLAASSLILADLIERVTGAGQFVIGDTKVRPRVTATFNNDEKLGIYVQLYHLSNGVIDYQITRTGTDAVVLNYTEEAGDLHGSASQMTVKKWLPLRDLAAGSYTLRMKVVDRDRNQQVTPSAAFTIIQQ
ncbi:MAG TPA: GWxTD domain-containing protein [Bryobacteraceae bacterium]|nr:GWxTD domain-containing protein [Bryobacteraceae bacterium]